MNVEDLRFEGLLGQGAMAKVYGVEHVPSGLRGALKVGAAANPRAKERFLTEARALSTLAHPRIVSAWDYGLGQGEHAELPPGQPYLLMERGVSTMNPDGFQSWAQLHPVIEDVLRGLAHLHGHRFVHGDIKPANIVQFGDGYKVADLGIVTEIHGSPAARLAGSPMSMAPEQIRSAMADFGPPTDLYGLGATLWRTLCGSWPFFDLDPVPTAPLLDDLPDFRPRFSVPSGLESWMRVLLSRDAYSRFQSAAHARLELPGIDTDRVAPSAPQSTTVSTSRPTLDLDTLEFVTPPTQGSTLERTTWELPATPPHTHSILPFEASGLWGLRPLPLVGREEEQQKIWDLAREVVNQEVLRVIVFRGPHGSGRTRLAQWAGSTLHETVGAAYLSVPEAGGPAGPTIEDALRQGYGLKGLSATECGERLGRVLSQGPFSDPADHMELMRLLGLFEEGPPTDIAARTRLMSLSLRQAGRTVVHFDDVSAGCPAVSDTIALLEREPTTPALLLLTASQHDNLKTLLRYPEVTEIVLGDLPDRAFGEIANVMGAAATDLERAKLFASRTPAMARAVFAPVRAPTKLPAPQAQCLALAAVLGHSFAFATWQRAAAAAGLEPDGLDEAIRTGILRPDGETHLVFDSPLFQAGVHPSGSTAKRLHHACLHAVDPETQPIRYAVHALEADLPERSIGPLKRGLAQAKAAGVRSRVVALTNLLLTALERSGGAVLERAEHYVDLTKNCLWAVSHDEAKKLSQRTLEACASATPELRLQAYFAATQTHMSSKTASRMCQRWAIEDPDLRAELTVRASLHELMAGNVSRAESLLRGTDPDSLLPYAREHYWRSVAELHWQRGRLDAAAHACRQAIDLSTDAVACPSAISLGYVLLEKGDLTNAEAQFREVIRANLKNGTPVTGTDAMSGLGKVHERRGEFERAADLWVEVARMLLVRGSVFAAASIADLSLLYARVGRLDQARVAAEQARQVAVSHDDQVWEFVAAVTLIASVEDPKQWPLALAEAIALSNETDFHDPDLLRALHLGRSRCPPEFWPQIDLLIDRLAVNE